MREHQQPHTERNNHESLRNVNKNVTFRDVVAGKRKNDEGEKVIQLGREETEITRAWKNRSVIAEVKDMKSLKMVDKTLEVIFPNTMELRYLGGLKFLITFGSQMEAEDFRISFKESWEEIFVNIREWKVGAERFERLAWIKIVGIPFMLWSKELCESIGKSFGRIVSMDNINVNSGNLNEVRLGVIVDTGKEIKDEFKVRYRDQEFKVWILEISGIWAPEFIPGRFLLINPIENKVEPEKQDTPMKEQSPVSNPMTEQIPVEAQYTTEGKIGRKEDEGTGSQNDKKENRIEENEEDRNYVFGGNWEELFGSQENTQEVQGEHEERENPKLNNLDTDKAYNWKNGPSSNSTFEAQTPGRIKGAGPRRKSKTDKIKQDMWARKVWTENVTLPDLNVKVPDPLDPFGLDDIIWNTNPTTKATKRKKWGKMGSNTKKQRRDDYIFPEKRNDGRKEVKNRSETRCMNSRLKGTMELSRIGKKKSQKRLKKQLK
ncbi:hypothetical protein HanIR_Chr04g0193201 [Helianthus annuus]|nr:hypothetical protein HanIR_Chr04g0193201 [Helianthus annuus]